MSFPLRPASYNYFTSLIRTSVRRGNKELILQNYQNKTWVIEYTTTFFAWKGYEPWMNQQTTFRRFKRFVEYYFFIWPELHDVRTKEDMTFEELARIMGYKNMTTLINSTNITAARSFLRGYHAKKAPRAA